MAFKVGRSRTEFGDEEDAALARDRVLITRDTILQWKLEGRVFYCQQGDAATKLDFNNTTYDPNQPEFNIDIPEGQLLIPLSLSVTLEDVAGTANHVLWSTCTVEMGAGTSTALAIVNYRRDNKYASACKAYSKYTGDTATQTGLVEVKRWYHPYASVDVTDAVDLHHHVWTINDPDMPILYGPASLMMHNVGTTKLQGFGEYIWAEMAAADLGL